MPRALWFRRSVAALAISIGLSPFAAADVEVVRSFELPGGDPLAAPVEGRDGWFYGTTTTGGAQVGTGTVYRADRSGRFETIYSFDWFLDAGPEPFLQRMPDGRIFGSTQNAVFVIDAEGKVRTLAPALGASFAAAQNGDVFAPTGTEELLLITPTGELRRVATPGFIPFEVAATAGGEVYFVANDSEFAPVLFRLSGNGALERIESLAPLPNAEMRVLVPMGENGIAFFGSTTSGTRLSRVSRDGVTALTDLDFAGLQIVLSPTKQGGLCGFSDDPWTWQGTDYAFCISERGEVSILHEFGPETEGLTRQPPLMTSDGTIYGSTLGTLFSIDPRGRFRQVASLVESHNINSAALVEASDGEVFGVTTPLSAVRVGEWIAQLFQSAPSGGPEFFRMGDATFFRVERSGGIERLHDLNATELGREPTFFGAQLADGAALGRTQSGGAHGTGTLFAVDRSGHFRKLYDVPRGASPPQALARSEAGYTGVAHGSGFVPRDVGLRIDRRDGTVTEQPASRTREGLLGSPGVLRYPFHFIGGRRADTAVILRADANGSLRVVRRVQNTPPLDQVGLVYPLGRSFVGAALPSAVTPRGALIQIDEKGSPAVLHEFTPADGAVADYALLPRADGSLLGHTRILTGATREERLFRLTAAGALVRLGPLAHGRDAVIDFGVPLPGGIVVALNPFSNEIERLDASDAFSTHPLPRGTPCGLFGLAGALAVGLSRHDRSADVFQVLSNGAAQQLGTIDPAVHGDIDCHALFFALAGRDTLLVATPLGGVAGGGAILRVPVTPAP